MSTNDDDRVDDSVQEQRIEKLEAQARQAAGGQMMSWESDVLPTDEREQCWQRVMHFENAPHQGTICCRTPRKTKYPPSPVGRNGGPRPRHMGKRFPAVANRL